MTANTRTPRLTAIFLAGAVMAGLPGCKQEAASTPAPPIPEVQVITVTTQSVPDEPEFIGQTESSRPVEIRSQVTGIIKEWSFQEGRAGRGSSRAGRAKSGSREAAPGGAGREPEGRGRRGGGGISREGGTGGGERGSGQGKVRFR